MRLIDADALMNDLMKVRWAYQMLDNTQRADVAMGGLRNAEKKVEEALTIDAVPVVRCKDCKWWNDGMQMCGISISATPYGHCHDGERKEDD